jgi:hypothetical protein
MVVAGLDPEQIVSPVVAIAPLVNSGLTVTVQVPVETSGVVLQ